MEKIKEVEVTEVSAYEWTCPECSTMNINDIYSDLICDGCNKKFKPKIAK